MSHDVPELNRDNTLIITTSKSVYNKYKTNGFEVVSLSAYLGVSTRDRIYTLYQVFDFFFSGDVSSKEQMLKIIFSAFIDESKSWSYCVVVEDTVCWFRVIDGCLRRLGSMSVTDPASSLSVGEFVKKLRYNLVISGVGLNKLTFLTYGQSMLSEYYPVYKNLKGIFYSIEGLKGLTLNEIYWQLSSNISVNKTKITALDLVDALSDSYKALGLSFNGSHISCRYRYYKDYSDCRYKGISARNCEYFFIVDCEGVTGGDGSLQAGCRQVGVILCARCGDILMSVYRFLGDAPLISEVLSGVPDVYRDITDRPISSKGIKVYTYGISDKVMLESQIAQSDKKIRKKLSGVFNFIDVKPSISVALDKTNMTGKRTLQNIARHFGAYVIRPKHNALADARTLFNILAVLEKGEHILNET